MAGATAGCVDLRPPRALGATRDVAGQSQECWIHKYLYYSMLLLFPTPTPCAFLRGSLSLSASHGPPKARSTGLLGLSLSSGGPLGRPKTEFKRIYGFHGVWLPVLLEANPHLGPSTAVGVAGVGWAHSVAWLS